MVGRECDLLEIVLAANPCRALANFLHGRQKQTDQDGKMCQCDEQLDEGKPGATHTASVEDGMEKTIDGLPF